MRKYVKEKLAQTERAAIVTGRGMKTANRQFLHLTARSGTLPAFVRIAYGEIDLHPPITTSMQETSEETQAAIDWGQSQRP